MKPPRWDDLTVSDTPTPAWRVVLLDDAEPHAVAVQLTLLAQGDSGARSDMKSFSCRAEYGAFMEPSGRNQW
jgi:hypothetical protein